MKKLTILTITILLLLVGCSNNVSFYTKNNAYEAKKLAEDSSKSGYSIEYEMLDGTVEREVKVNSTSIKVDIVSKDGKADLIVKDPDGNTIYQGNDIDTNNFTLEDIKKSEKYTIIIIANNHKGSFKFQW